MPQFWFLFSVSICILLCKGILAFKCLTNSDSFSLKSGLGFMSLFLFIARIFWTILDFHLTSFNTHDIYMTDLNSFFFKSATILMGLGFAAFIFVIDKRVLRGKLMGIPALLLVALLVVLGLSPLSNLDDFNSITKLQLYMNLFGLVIPGVFIHRAVRVSSKDKKSRKYYIFSALGVIIYAIGANLLNESIMMAMRHSIGNTALYVNYSLLLVFKSSGLVLLYSGVKKIGMV